MHFSFRSKHTVLYEECLQPALQQPTSLRPTIPFQTVACFLTSTEGETLKIQTLTQALREWLMNSLLVLFSFSFFF